MVRAGSFLDLRPIAEARVLNLREGRPSLCLEDAGEDGYFSLSSARLEKERFARSCSLEGFERDHHGRGGGGEEIAGDIRGREGKECEVVEEEIKGTAVGRDH